MARRTRKKRKDVDWFDPGDKAFFEAKKDRLPRVARDSEKAKIADLVRAWEHYHQMAQPLLPRARESDVPSPLNVPHAYHAVAELMRNRMGHERPVIDPSKAPTKAQKDQAAKDALAVCQLVDCDPTRVHALGDIFTTIAPAERAGREGFRREIDRLRHQISGKIRNEMRSAMDDKQRQEACWIVFSHTFSVSELDELSKELCMCTVAEAKLRLRDRDEIEAVIPHSVSFMERKRLAYRTINLMYEADGHFEDEGRDDSQFDGRRAGSAPTQRNAHAR
eukprot:g2535.t1